MAAFSTHYVFAKEAIPVISKIANFPVCKEAIYLGAQGADIFFFHRVFPWMKGKSLRSIGSKIHRARPDKIFQAMRAYCQNHNSAIAWSYTYGFILHYALDRKCHPYVYALQNELVKSGEFSNPHTAHNIIEYGIDSYILNKRYYIKNPKDFNTANTITFNENLLNEIASLIEHTVFTVTGVELKASQAKQALIDTKAVQSALLDKNGIKRKILSVFDCISAPFTKSYKLTAMLRPRLLENGEKYANIEKRPWQSPFDNITRYDSFDELFEKALDEAISMIKDFQAGKDCYAITKNLSFLTGVEVK